MQAADELKLAPDNEVNTVQDTVDPHALDSHLDRKIVTKIDGVVLTLVTLVATLEFLDKNVSADWPYCFSRQDLIR
jgi:hypothetical protein